jgi:hypothetical protein
MIPLNINLYRTALFFYILLLSVFTFPFFWGGEVVAPYRQFEEVALTEHSGALQIENRKFNDFGNGYIPSVTEYLSSSRSGWQPAKTTVINGVFQGVLLSENIQLVRLQF